MSGARRVPPVLWVLPVLGLFALALYARSIFGGRVFAEGDLLLYFAPYRDYAAAALRAGRIPFWNPYLFAGAPFLANPQAAVLYPPHWPLSWLPAHQQIVWSAVLHVWLLGCGAYFLVRRLGGSVLAALTTALVLQGSGFVGGLTGHLNQLNGVAWLPWLLLWSTPPQAGWTPKSSLLETLWLALVVALMLLAGHAQTTYINLVGAGVWLLLLGWRAVRQARRAAAGSARWHSGLDAAAVLFARLVVACVLGVLLAMPQLLPMLELSSRGLRSGGLSYAEATSFSLPPLQLIWSLLPSYGLADLESRFGTPAWSEFLAWVGLCALALAALALWVWRGKQRARPPGPVALLTAGGALLALVGFLLALGRWNPLYWLLYAAAPGFGLFRTPARWMVLYTLGLALLAGAGVLALQAGARSRRLAVAAPLLVVLELLLASLALPSAHATAPLAIEAVRTAPAHLLSAPERLAALAAGHDPAAASRFLGMSTITYDPGDLADLQRIYRDPVRPQLSQQAFDALIVALKVQELLVPNLPLAQRVAALDGYDGGLLPVNRYMLLASLLAPAETLVADGRLREQIDEVPPAALLGLLDVQHVVTDKVRDLWFEDVFYDRQIGARLHAGDAALEVDAAPAFAATHVDLIAYVEPAPGAPPGTLAALAGVTQNVATVRVESAQGGEEQAGEELAGEELAVRAGAAAGAHLADGALDSALADASGAVVALRDEEGGRQLYRVRLELAAPGAPQRLLLQATNPALDVVVQAATLVDARSGMFQALLPSDRGPFRLTHSGDVKVYENLAPTVRASLITDVRRADSPEQALAILGTLDAGTQAVVEGDVPTRLLEPPFSAAEAAPGPLQVVAYAPERVELRTASDVPALLLLRDAWDPGWTATIDGAPAPVLPADVHFRGVVLEAGSHTVIFSYRPPGWAAGCALAALGVALWLLLLLLAPTRGRQRIAQPGRRPAAL